jgi:hypothetical protein
VLLGEPCDAARPPAMTLSIPVFALTFLILVLTDGLGEELGWRWVPHPTPPQLNRSPLRAAAVSCLSRLNHSYRVGSGEDGESS